MCKWLYFILTGSGAAGPVAHGETGQGGATVVTAQVYAEESTAARVYAENQDAEDRDCDPPDGQEIRASVDYVGTDDVRLFFYEIKYRDRDNNPAGSGPECSFVDKDAHYADEAWYNVVERFYFTFLRAEISIWAESTAGRQKRGSIEWTGKTAPEFDPFDWYDEGQLTPGETYEYSIEAVFFYEKEIKQSIRNVPYWRYWPGYWDLTWGEWETLSTEVVQVAYNAPVEKTATPGHVRGKLLRDTVWSGEITLTESVQVGRSDSDVHGVTLTLAPSSRVTTIDEEHWREPAIWVSYSNLIAHNVTFDGTGKVSTIITEGDTALGQVPVIDIRNSIFTGEMKIYEYLGGSFGCQFIFQGNSGDATGEIRVSGDPATPLILTGNELPGVGLNVSYPADSSPVETRIADNRLHNIFINGRNAEQQQPSEWTVAITGNLLTGTLFVQGLEGARSLHIARNECAAPERPDALISVHGPAWWDNVNDWPTADGEAFEIPPCLIHKMFFN